METNDTVVGENNINRFAETVSLLYLELLFPFSPSFLNVLAGVFFSGIYMLWSQENKILTGFLKSSMAIQC